VLPCGPISPHHGNHHPTNRCSKLQNRHPQIGIAAFQKRQTIDPSLEVIDYCAADAYSNSYSARSLPSTTTDDHTKDIKRDSCICYYKNACLVPVSIKGTSTDSTLTTASLPALLDIHSLVLINASLINPAFAETGCAA
jgi:hypothetical protein